MLTAAKNDVSIILFVRNPGERRRVQLCMGLMSPWDVLLLDEVIIFLLPTVSSLTHPRSIKVTVDLDVQVRDDLLTFLKEDSEARGSTVLCMCSSSPARR